MDLIIYHNNCSDGFCAAIIAQKKYPEAILMPRDHGTEPPYDEVTGKNVLVVDFSWRTREQNEKLASLAKSFWILDHHKTAQATLEGLGFATFDMNRSGAGLSWDYLFGISQPAVPGVRIFERPWYVNYVEDRDLWRHRLLASEQVNAYIGTLPFTPEAWAVLDVMTIQEAASLGSGALAHIRHYVREGVKQAQKCTLVNYPALIVNALYMNISELAGALAEQCNSIGIGYFERGDGNLQFSLRSRSDIDVSSIAQSHGGGGHKNAAGFQLSLKEGRAFIDQLLDRSSL